jgi:hypothetical protein
MASKFFNSNIDSHNNKLLNNINNLMKNKMDKQKRIEWFKIVEHRRKKQENHKINQLKRNEWQQMEQLKRHNKMENKLKTLQNQISKLSSENIQLKSLVDKLKHDIMMARLQLQKDSMEDDQKSTNMSFFLLSYQPGIKNVSLYDVVSNFLILASSEKTARECAQYNGGNEINLYDYSGQRSFWTNHKLTSCFKIGTSKLPTNEANVIIKDVLY